MIVRRLVADDHVALREVRLSALRGAPHAYGSTYEREIAFTDEVWRDRLLPGGNPHFGAFDNDGSLVGLAVGALDGDDPLERSWSVCGSNRRRGAATFWRA